MISMEYWHTLGGTRAEKLWLLLYKRLLRLQLEYFMKSWSPQHGKHVIVLQKVHGRFSRMCPMMALPQLERKLDRLDLFSWSAEGWGSPESGEQNYQGHRSSRQSWPFIKVFWLSRWLEPLLSITEEYVWWGGGVTKKLSPRGGRKLQCTPWERGESRDSHSI